MQLGEQLFRLFRPESLERQHLRFVQRVQVGWIAHAQLVVEQLRRLLAERLDVHRVARGEVGKARDRLRTARDAVQTEQMRAALR